MTVVAFVASPVDAKRVITWAGRFAASRGSELVILCLPAAPQPGELALDTDAAEPTDDETYSAFAVTNETREVLADYVNKMPGVEILFAGRAGIDRDSDPVDFGINLSSKRPLPRSAADELIRLIQTTMQNPDLKVRVECVLEGWAEVPVEYETVDTSLYQMDGP